MSRYLVAALTPLIKSVAAKSGPGMHRGWGEHIQWETLGDGLNKAQKEDKHIMVIVHLMSCPACVRSKHWFSKSTRLAEYSKEFVMVNMIPSEIPAYKQIDLSPDGHYVPRFIFLSPNGRVLRGIRTDHPNYGYVYGDESSLLTNMRKLLGGL